MENLEKFKNKKELRYFLVLVCTLLYTLCTRSNYHQTHLTHIYEYRLYIDTLLYVNENK